MAIADAKPWWSGEGLGHTGKSARGMDAVPYGPEVLAGTDLVVPSPGIPRQSDPHEAVRRGIPVLSELSALFHHNPDHRRSATESVDPSWTGVLEAVGEKSVANRMDRLCTVRGLAVVKSAVSASMAQTLIADRCSAEHHRRPYRLPRGSAYRGQGRIFSRQTARDLAILNEDEKESVALYRI